MAAYYNEIDPYAAQWLRNLIAAGHIAPGDVDTRSIEDVLPEDLRGFTQCHFFAGIGVWSHALRRAGWADDRPVWTGSCPCQPFSAAGKGGGFADERHFWPAWEWLIRQAKLRSVPIFGEQVASKAGLAWLDIVCDDLEGQGYTVRALDLCAAGAGAPHIRQRLFFVADTDGGHASAEGIQRGGEHGQQQEDSRARSGPVADAANERYQRNRHAWDGRSGLADYGVVGDAERAVLEGHGGHGDGAPGRQEQDRPTAAAGATNGYWNLADWLLCVDGKARPVEPGTFPLAHGIAARVGRLRAYGNAIIAPLAEQFIRAYTETL
jgi:DNA (cytosine-5)-methyltransferase 1